MTHKFVDSSIANGFAATDQKMSEGSSDFSVTEISAAKTSKLAADTTAGGGTSDDTLLMTPLAWGRFSTDALASQTGSASEIARLLRSEHKQSLSDHQNQGPVQPAPYAANPLDKTNPYGHEQRSGQGSEPPKERQEKPLTGDRTL